MTRRDQWVLTASLLTASWPDFVQGDGFPITPSETFSAKAACEGGTNVYCCVYGLLCCLGFTVVVFCCFGGGVLCFLLFAVWAGAGGGGGGGGPNSKKK